MSSQHLGSCKKLSDLEYSATSPPETSLKTWVEQCIPELQLTSPRFSPGRMSTFLTPLPFKGQKEATLQDHQTNPRLEGATNCKRKHKWAVLISCSSLPNAQAGLQCPSYRDWFIPGDTYHSLHPHQILPQQTYWSQAA